MFWSRAAQALAPRVGIWNFDIVCHLSIVIWSFRAVSLKANRFHLNLLALTLKFHWTLHGVWGCICCKRSRVSR